MARKTDIVDGKPRRYMNHREYGFWYGVNCVYRMYASDGRLLYVGVSSNIVERMRAHRRTSPFWPDTARTVIKVHPTRRAALDAERAAIQTEHPLHNKQHSLWLVA